MISPDQDMARSVSAERTPSVFDRDRQIRSSELTMPHTFYLCTLNQFVGNNGHAWPSQRTIAEAMTAGLSSVKKWQAELEALGIITVDSGVGCMAQNHYRIDFGRLKPKTKTADASNGLPHRPFNTERSTSETINGLRGRPGMVSDIAPKEQRKIHKKEQPDLLPPELDTDHFRACWQNWTKHRREIRKTLTPSTIAKQLTTLAAWGPERAIRSIEQSILNGWIGLFDPDRHSDTTAHDAEQAWQTMLVSLRKHSRFAPEPIKADIGDRAWRVVQSVGLKRIEEANEYDKNKLKKQFVNAFNERGEK
jgi:hypothetical protein